MSGGYVGQRSRRRGRYQLLILFLIFLIGIGCIWRSKFNEDSTYDMCYIFLCFLGIEGIGFLSEMCFQI